MATANGRKPRGISLHLGLNAVDPQAYGGWSGDLNACENDANDMAALARAQGIKPTVLLTRKATRAALLKALRSAAGTLVKGDLLLLSYSGHGGQVPDVSGDEDDHQDETWCLYDGQLIDDELYLELGKFAAGVRVMVLSDSCHSGTVVRAGPPPLVAPTPGARSRQMPPDVARRTYAQHQAFYDQLQREVAKAAGGASPDPDDVLASLHVSSGRTGAITRRFRGSVLLISGCQDNQTSLDGPHNGAFTGRLLQVWNHARFKGDYKALHDEILLGMPATQTPRLFSVGPVARFVRQQPFTV